MSAADKSRHRAPCRRATVSGTPIYMSPSLPLSDIGDWAVSESPTTATATAAAGQTLAAMWPAYTLRRARSWIASAPQGLPALPSWLRIEGMALPRRINVWPIGSLALRRQQSMDCCIRAASDGDGDDDASCGNSSHTSLHKKDCIDSESLPSLLPWTSEAKCTVAVLEGTEPSSAQRPRRHHLMSVFQIPAYMAEDYIWDAYRPLCFSYAECARSWGYVHSELGNIMTHLAGFVVFVILALLTGPYIMPYISRHRPEGAPPVAYADYAIVYVYLGAVLFCLASSVAFHTLACHSQGKHFRSLRCDFIGILTLIVGSFVPVGYFAFLHLQKLLIGYMAMFVAIGIAGVAVSICGKVEDPRRAGWRPIIFFAIAITGLVPIVHGAVVNGYRGAVSQMSLWYVIGMGVLYIAGTLVYAFKIPERYRPGKHNVCLSSHQIFHVFVVLAAICHYIGIIRALVWAH
ncbi:hypothetical protein GGI02_004755, partial [Coemansia sp. RSA 2322]